MGVLPSHRRRVPLVGRCGRGQHGEIGVAEQGAVGVPGVDQVPGGEQDQPADLGHRVGREPETGEQPDGQLGAVPLVRVATGPRVVDRVVAPRGQPDQVRSYGERGVPVDHVQHRAEMVDGVVVPVRLPPPAQQLLPGFGRPGRAGRAGAPGRRRPPFE
ncbi:hypothetical protein D7147_21190 [Micromonospora musae]|uniref:Uncharacterized protein n=1 Tax=Micromonospora musae TaxID=1894970 RepID=A0A3A9YG72_9ACTN|nr:hypothetical protein D7147_21190 [Micromonospora musae]RKN31097.1 hypothetical protein D7044_17750 [Micromonospora musae]